MAGWSMTADSSSLDSSGTPEKLKSSSYWIDLEPSSEGSIAKSEPDKLRFWFNKFLGHFLKEVCSCIWPLPPMLGDGQPVDLLKLFLVVRERGGYNAVSQSGSWSLVTKESGLGLNVASYVRLVYVKYLVSLERWSENIVESKDWEGESNFSGHMVEFGTELKEFLKKSSKKVVKYSQDSVMAESDQGEKYAKDEQSVDIDVTKNVCKGGPNLQNTDDLISVAVDSDYAKKCIDVDDVKSAVKEDSMEINSESNDIKENSPSPKRKRTSMWKMLNWVTKVAKDPCDPVLGSLPDVSKWKSYGSEELWKQVLLYREFALLRKENHSSDDQSNSQKSRKMHPYMYEDYKPSGYNLRDRSSGTKVNYRKMSSKGQDYSQSSEKHSDYDTSMVETDNQPRGTFDSTSPGSGFSVPIGPSFQADVPKWTVVASESDPKWTGTRIWPLDKKENKFLIERDPIGKGRQDSCGCHIPDSIQCVQFHVSEKISKLKLELGSAFDQWKFDTMGEKVAVGWNQEERRKFYSIVKSDASSSDNSFWDEIYKRFPNKSREELVSYYFNVFVLQSRARQNRNTPININSDDDDESHVKSNRHNLLAKKKSYKNQGEESDTKTEKKFKKTH